jgi:hypothetical protein
LFRFNRHVFYFFAAINYIAQIKGSVCAQDYLCIGKTKICVD